jgi:hypothetical protein
MGKGKACLRKIVDSSNIQALQPVQIKTPACDMNIHIYNGSPEVSSGLITMNLFKLVLLKSELGMWLLTEQLLCI